MKPVPTDPLAFGNHVIAALCADLAEGKPHRVNALREIARQTRPLSDGVK